MIEPIVAVVEAYLYQLYSVFYRVLCDGNTICRESIGDYQCVFRRTTSTADPIFRIRQTLGEGRGGWEYSGATRRLVGDFSKAKYSGRREIYIIFPLR
jgi:hypothetical protein